MKQIRIVIADDHEVVRVGIKALLHQHSELHVVGEASTGEEAIEQVEMLNPDVVVMDIRMPGMSGVDLLRSLRSYALTRDIAFLMITGDGDRNHIAEAANAGASGYIVKPFTKATLEEKVAKIVQKIAR